MMISENTEMLLGPLSQIPLGEGRVFSVGGENIAVFNTRGGGIYATQSECPHRQAPLADGLIGGTTLMCPFHAWKFNLVSGEVLQGNCGLKTYPLRVTPDGQIWLTFDASAPLPCLISRDEMVGISQAPVGSAVGPASSAPA